MRLDWNECARTGKEVVSPEDVFNQIQPALEVIRKEIR